MKSIVNTCVTCRKKFKRLAQQKMAPLPIERLKPAPAFTSVGLDYFGPYATKGEVQKRTRGKGYGIIIACDVSRAVYVDFVPDYSTDKFLQALRRFATFRGWPSKIHSDPGSQLKCASTELQQAIKNLDRKQMQQYCHQNGTQWSFHPADAPWYNGSTEALVKTVKRCLNAVIKTTDHAFTFSEYLTIFYEVAELVNERPIGRKPSSPEELAYLCPNDLLLGRSTSAIPQGPFDDNASTSKRIHFIQSVVNSF